MNIDRAIRIFADFLNSSWIKATQLLVNREYISDEGSINDWLQANWELLVERKVLNLNEYLEVYGDGSDFNGASSRVTDHDALPNFQIVVNPRTEKAISDLLNREDFWEKELKFEKIVGFEGSFYTVKPEFKYALVIDNSLGVERVVTLDDVKFELKKI